MKYTRNTSAGNILDEPIVVPGIGYVKRVGPWRYRGSSRNPYKVERFLATSARIVIGLRTGTKFDAEGGNEIGRQDVEKVAVTMRKTQVGEDFAGLNFADSRGVFRSKGEDTIEVLLFPQGADDVERPEQDETAENMHLFWYHVEQLARSLGAHFEQDQVIVSEVRDGRAEVAFYTWKTP